MIYLITGGTGFIGKKLCEKLLKENNELMKHQGSLKEFNAYYEEQKSEGYIDNQKKFFEEIGYSY